MIRILLLVSFLLSASALSAPRCERELLVPNTVISVSRTKSASLSVTLHTHAGEAVQCPDVALNKERLLYRHINVLLDDRPLSTDTLIGFISSPWLSLSNSAGQTLSNALSAKTRLINDAQLKRLLHLVISNQTHPYTGKMIVRIISKRPGDAAVNALGTVLRQSTRLSVQRAAARALGRSPQRAAHRLLQACVKNEDRMLSSRCERSLVRWATQHSLER